MVELRKDDIQVPYRPLWAEVVSSAAALSPLWFGLPVTVLVLRYLLPWVEAKVLPGGLWASEADTYALLAHSLEVASLVTVVLALYAAILSWVTRRMAHERFGQEATRSMANWRTARAIRKAWSSLKSHAAPGEQFWRATEVDAAYFRRPAHLTSVVLGLAALTGVLFLVSYSAQVNLMPELSLHLVWVAFGGLPVLAWLTAISLELGPAALLFLLWMGTIGVHQLFAVSSPDVLVFLSRSPPELAGRGGWFALSAVVQVMLFLGLYLRRSKCRILVLSTKGLRLYDLFLWRARPVTKHFIPTKWVGHPGPAGERWSFHILEGPPIEVTPSDPNVGLIHNGLIEVASAPEFEGQGGLETPADELTRAPIRRLGLLAAWVGAAAALLVPLLHRGLVLHLGPRREVPVLAREAEGGARLEAAARGSIEQLGENFVSIGMLSLALEAQDRFEEADEVLEQARKLESRVWIPGMLLHSAGFTLVREARDRRSVRLRYQDGPARGWEPRDPEALRAFRLGLAACGALPSRWKADERRALEQLSLARERSPKSPAPRILTALYAFEFPARLPEGGAPPPREVPTPTRIAELFEAREKAFREVWAQLRPLENHYRWKGAKLEGRYPDTLVVWTLAEILRARAYYGEPQGEDARALKQVLNHMDSMDFIPVLGDALRLEEVARFLEAPPTHLWQVMRVWPGRNSGRLVRPSALGLKSWFQALYLAPELLEERLRALPGAHELLLTPVRPGPG
jgi:hypothetical protein